MTRLARVLMLCDDEKFRLDLLELVDNPVGVKAIVPA